MNLDYACEGLFNPQQTVDSLMETIKKNIEAKYTTDDELLKLSEKISEESAKFNQCLTELSNTMRKCEQGEISKEEAAAECAPIVQCLKSFADCSGMCGINFDSEDITESEIQMVSELLSKTKAHVESLLSNADNSAFESAVYDDEDIATEGLANLKLANQILKSNDMKTADAYYAQARRLYGMGDKEKAKSYLAKAKKLYEKTLERAKKMSNMTKVERRVRAGIATPVSASVEDKFITEGTGVISLAQLIKKIDNKIAACTATLMQWDNKAGAESFKKTKNDLEFERAKSRVAQKARKSADKDARKYAKDTATEAMSDLEILAVCEAMMNELEASDMIAMESTSATSDPKIARLKELAIVIKNNADGDERALERAKSEYSKILDDIGRDAAEKYTEDDFIEHKKKVRRLAIAGTITAALLATVGGIYAYKNKDKIFNRAAEKVISETDKLKDPENNKVDAKGSTNIFKKVVNMITGKNKTTPANENYSINRDDAIVEKYCLVMEALMDEIQEDLENDIAYEGAGYEVAMEASSIGARIRAAFGKLRRGGKTQNSKEVEAAASDIEDAADELESAAKEAETEEEKQKLSKAAKIGLAAAAAAAITISGILIKKGIDKKKAKKLVDTAKKAETLALAPGNPDPAKSATAIQQISQGITLALPATTGADSRVMDERSEYLAEQGRSADRRAASSKRREEAAKKLNTSSGSGDAIALGSRSDSTVAKNKAKTSANVEKFKGMVDEYKARDGKVNEEMKNAFMSRRSDKSDAAYRRVIDEERAEINRMKEDARAALDMFKEQAQMNREAARKRLKAARASVAKDSYTYDDGSYESYLFGDELLE